mmetsp:Transcript_2720/g.8250  ORF Transcript_2720/g.8250 Transcript_2720/m.8250 type:complete len:193 (+) Transcript_2720:99-677(+)
MVDRSTEREGGSMQVGVAPRPLPRMWHAEACGRKGATEVGQMVAHRRNVVVTGESPVDELIMEVMTMDREGGGRGRFRLMRVREMIAEAKEAGQFCAMFRRRLLELTQLGRVVLFITELELLPLLCEKPQLLYPEEDPQRVQRIVTHLLDMLVELVRNEEVVCVAYSRMQRLHPLIKHDKLASVFRAMITSN